MAHGAVWSRADDGLKGRPFAAQPAANVKQLRRRLAFRHARLYAIKQFGIGGVRNGLRLLQRFHFVERLNQPQLIELVGKRL